MARDEKKPAIRFAGFTDPWEQREFSLFFDCSIPSNTLSRANLSFEKGEIKNVHYGDVLIKFGAYIDVKKETIPCIIHANEENYRNQFLQNGDVIMADAAEDETVGKASEIVNLGSLKVVSGLHTIVCRPREKKQPYFLGYYINSQSFHSQLLPLMQGTKVSSLSRTNLSKTYICYPTNPKEQAQIGNFFRNVDNLITLHQRKCDKLISVKKSMLEKMFPQNGSSVPEIRFAGFTDPWEQRKLGELGEVYTGNTPPTSEVANWSKNNEGHVWITPTDINSLIMNNSERHLSAIGWKKARSVPANSVLITSIASIGKNAVTTVETAFNQQINAIVPRGNNSYFILSAMENEKSRFLGIAGKTATPIINKTEFEKFCISMPKLSEQNTIGEFFSRLDNLITLHQRKVEKLKNIKKSLLEKMFV